MLAAPLGRCQNQRDSRLQTLLETTEPLCFSHHLPPPPSPQDRNPAQPRSPPRCRADLKPGMCQIPQRAETRCHGEQTPPVLGTEEALVEPMLLARDTMLPFRAFSMKSAGIKIVPGSVTNSGCDRAQGREGHPRAAAATHGRGWHGPGTYRSPGHCRRRPRPPARGRRAEETRQRGWGGDRGPRPGALPPPGARSARGAPAPPEPRLRRGLRHRLARALTRAPSLPPYPQSGAHPARPPRAPSRRAALRPRGTRRPGPTRSRSHLAPRVLGGGARRLRHLPPARSCDRRGARAVPRRQGAPRTVWP